MLAIAGGFNSGYSVFYSFNFITLYGYSCALYGTAIVFSVETQLNCCSIMESFLSYHEDCHLTKAQEDIAKIRIAITVTSGIGMFVGIMIIIVMLSAKAYKSFLQRLILWLMLMVLLQDLCRVAGIYHKFCYGKTFIVVLQDKACEILGFITIWIFWCIYMFLIAIILYLFIMVVLQTRDDSALIAKFRNSTRLQILLEFGITLGTLFGPGVALWVPYYENQYGFDGAKCGLKPSNYSARSRKDDAVISVYNYTNIELTGLIAILAALAMGIVYCTSSARLQQAKRVIKNVLIFLVGVIGYVVVYDLLNVTLKFVKGGYQLSIFSVCFAVAGKFVLLIGYLSAFHFSKLCDPMKKLLKSKVTAPLLQEHKHEKHYNSVKETKSSEPTRSTFFDVPYTGQFTTITKE